MGLFFTHCFLLFFVLTAFTFVAEAKISKNLALMSDNELEAAKRVEKRATSTTVAVIKELQKLTKQMDSYEVLEKCNEHSLQKVRRHRSVYRLYKEVLKLEYKFVQEKDPEKAYKFLMQVVALGIKKRTQMKELVEIAWTKCNDRPEIMDMQRKEERLVKKLIEAKLDSV